MTKMLHLAILMVALTGGADEVLACRPSSGHPNACDEFNLEQAEQRRAKYNEEIAALTTIIEKQPTNYDAFVMRGMIYADFLLDYSRAIKDFSQAIRLNPNNSSALRNRAQAFKMIQDFGSAIADYTEMIRIEGGTLHSLRGRADALFRVGSPDDAIADYTAALAINPRDSAALLGRSEAFRAKGDLERADSDFALFQSTLTKR